ncbi:hypothetical protein SELMODRAFT_419129 [Selaginella moellendorffii]|uniref:Uncharacterized protein n=1 Tax=Selaginella moellendorffii TaxID=88036 RepID=D8S7Y0_SELML|nr:hypothetical protein SELMODRAFT_419129 [Selaginella moellendorffii]
MTLLACCRRHLDGENGKLCAERLFVLDPENVSPYKILVEIYSQTGRANDIAGLKKMVRDKGLHKLEAESLIQIDGITHKFRVGDTAHPSIKKVRKEVARGGKIVMDLFVKSTLEALREESSSNAKQDDYFLVLVAVDSVESFLDEFWVALCHANSFSIL